MTSLRRSSRRLVRIALHPQIIINAVSPYVAFELLSVFGVSEVVALACSAVIPLIGVVYGALRTRRVQWLGSIAFVAIVVSLGGGLLFNDARLLLVRDSISTGIIGAAFALTLLGQRPMVFSLGRQLALGKDENAREHYDRQWDQLHIRSAYRRLTAVWAIALFADCATRVALSFALRPATLLLVSPFLSTAILGTCAIWTHRYRTRHMSTRQTWQVPAAATPTA
jgi:intracellular septation protein A